MMNNSSYTTHNGLYKCKAYKIEAVMFQSCIMFGFFFFSIDALPVPNGLAIVSATFVRFNATTGNARHCVTARRNYWLGLNLWHSLLFNTNLYTSCIACSDELLHTSLPTYFCIMTMQHRSPRAFKLEKSQPGPWFKCLSNIMCLMNGYGWLVKELITLDAPIIIAINFRLV